ncbi:MAG: hypothetical protein QOJ29_789 [Thermoleophilaceae bacterium]|nr:hypothetical protein [Thermoleophilaceae bacterium]
MLIRKFLKGHMLALSGGVAPDDDDLSAVLSHIAPNKLARTRHRIANSPDTRLLLECGLDLLHHDLLDHRGPDLETGEDRSTLFASLSRERIVSCAVNKKITGVRPTPVVFRERWPLRALFSEDLISYLFRLAPQQQRLRQINAFVDDLPPDLTFEDIVRVVAETEMDGSLHQRDIGLQIVVQGAMPNHPHVREYVQATYETVLPAWAGIYEKVASHYGLRLRPGVSWLDMAMLFDAVLEGAALRDRCQTERVALSNGEPLLAGAIFALLPTLLEDFVPTWDTSQLSHFKIPAQTSREVPRPRSRRAARVAAAK